jgi:hypothetical protein
MSLVHSLTIGRFAAALDGAQVVPSVGIGQFVPAL